MVGTYREVKSSLCETVLRSSGTFDWDGVKGVTASQQDDKYDNVKEGVGMLTKDDWIKKMFDCRSHSSKIISYEMQV